MITFVPGVGPVDDSKGAGTAGGPPAIVPTGASGDIPVDPGQSTALPSSDPTTAPPPVNDQVMQIDPTTGLPV